VIYAAAYARLIFDVVSKTRSFHTLNTTSSQSAHLPWQHHVRAYDALKLKGGRWPWAFNNNFVDLVTFSIEFQLVIIEKSLEKPN